MSDQPITSRSFMRRERGPLPTLPRWIKLISPFNFIWVFAFAGLVSLIELQGTPHLLVSYTYFGSREHKSSCDYFGLHSQSLSAVNGDCPFIQLLR